MVDKLTICSGTGMGLTFLARKSVHWPRLQQDQLWANYLLHQPNNLCNVIKHSSAVDVDVNLRAALAQRGKLCI
jgi:hypothetical protein